MELINSNILLIFIKYPHFSSINLFFIKITPTPSLPLQKKLIINNNLNISTINYNILYLIITIIIYTL